MTQSSSRYLYEPISVYPGALAPILTNEVKHPGFQSLLSTETVIKNILAKLEERKDLNCEVVLIGSCAKKLALQAVSERVVSLIPKDIDIAIITQSDESLMGVIYKIDDILRESQRFHLKPTAFVKIEKQQHFFNSFSFEKSDTAFHLPLEISSHAVFDLTTPLHTSNSNSFQIPLKLFGEELGSTGPGKYEIFSMEGNAREVGLEVLNGKFRSSVASRGLGRSWFRAILEFTEGLADCPIETNRDFYNTDQSPEMINTMEKYLKKKEPSFLMHFCYALNALFASLSAEEALLEKGDKSRSYLFIKNLKSLLQQKDSPYQNLPKWVLKTDEILSTSDQESVISDLKTFLPKIASDVTLKRHMEKAHLQCRFQDDGRDYYILVPLPDQTEFIQKLLFEIREKLLLNSNPLSFEEMHFLLKWREQFSLRTVLERIDSTDPLSCRDLFFSLISEPEKAESEKTAMIFKKLYEKIPTEEKRQCLSSLKEEKAWFFYLFFEENPEEMDFLERTFLLQEKQIPSFQKWLKENPQFWLRYQSILTSRLNECIKQNKPKKIQGLIEILSAFENLSFDAISLILYSSSLLGEISTDTIDRMILQTMFFLESEKHPIPREELIQLLSRSSEKVRLNLGEKYFSLRQTNPRAKELFKFLIETNLLPQEGVFFSLCENGEDNALLCSLSSFDEKEILEFLRFFLRKKSFDQLAVFFEQVFSCPDLKKKNQVCYFLLKVFLAQYLEEITPSLWTALGSFITLPNKIDKNQELLKELLISLTSSWEEPACQEKKNFLKTLISQIKDFDLSSIKSFSSDPKKGFSFFEKMRQIIETLSEGVDWYDQALYVQATFYISSKKPIPALRFLTLLYNKSEQSILSTLSIILDLCPEDKVHLAIEEIENSFPLFWKQLAKQNPRWMKNPFIFEKMGKDSLPIFIEHIDFFLKSEERISEELLFKILPFASNLEKIKIAKKCIEKTSNPIAQTSLLAVISSIENFEEEFYAELFTSRSPKIWLTALLQTGLLRQENFPKHWEKIIELIPSSFVSKEELFDVKDSISLSLKENFEKTLQNESLEEHLSKFSGLMNLPLLSSLFTNQEIQHFKELYFLKVIKHLDFLIQNQNLIISNLESYLKKEASLKIQADFMKEICSFPPSFLSRNYSTISRFFPSTFPMQELTPFLEHFDWTIEKLKAGWLLLNGSKLAKNFADFAMEKVSLSEISFIKKEIGPHLTTEGKQVFVSKVTSEIAMQIEKKEAEGSDLIIDLITHADFKDLLFKDSSFFILFLKLLNLNISSKKVATPDRALKILMQNKEPYRELTEKEQIFKARIALFAYEKSSSKDETFPLKCLSCLNIDQMKTLFKTIKEVSSETKILLIKATKEKAKDETILPFLSLQLDTLLQETSRLDRGKLISFLRIITSQIQELEQNKAFSNYVSLCSYYLFKISIDAALRNGKNFDYNLFDQTLNEAIAPHRENPEKLLGRLAFFALNAFDLLEPSPFDKKNLHVLLHEKLLNYKDDISPESWMVFCRKTRKNPKTVMWEESYNKVYAEIACEKLGKTPTVETQEQSEDFIFLAGVIFAEGLNWGSILLFKRDEVHILKLLHAVFAYEETKGIELQEYLIEIYRKEVLQLCQETLFPLAELERKENLTLNNLIFLNSIRKVIVKDKENLKKEIEYSLVNFFLLLRKRCQKGVFPIHRRLSFFKEGFDLIKEEIQTFLEEEKIQLASEEEIQLLLTNKKELSKEEVKKLSFYALQIGIEKNLKFFEESSLEKSRKQRLI